MVGGAACGGHLSRLLLALRGQQRLLDRRGIREQVFAQRRQFFVARGVFLRVEAVEVHHSSPLDVPVAQLQEPPAASPHNVTSANRHDQQRMGILVEEDGTLPRGIT